MLVCFYGYRRVGGAYTGRGGASRSHWQPCCKHHRAACRRVRCEYMFGIQYWVFSLYNMHCKYFIAVSKSDLINPHI